MKLKNWQFEMKPEPQAENPPLVATKLELLSTSFSIRLTVSAPSVERLRFIHAANARNSAPGATETLPSTTTPSSTQMPPAGNGQVPGDLDGNVMIPAQVVPPTLPDDACAGADAASTATHAASGATARLAPGQ